MSPYTRSSTPQTSFYPNSQSSVVVSEFPGLKRTLNIILFHLQLASVRLRKKKGYGSISPKCLATRLTSFMSICPSGTPIVGPVKSQFAGAGGTFCPKFLATEATPA